MVALLAACSSDSEKEKEAADKQEEATETEEKEATEETEEAEEAEEVTEEPATEATEATEEEAPATETEEAAEANAEGNVPVYHEFDLGPGVDMSTVDQESLDQLQQLVNGFGEPTAGQIDFNGVYATYQEDGTLYVEVFVRNGTEHTIYNIESELKVLDANGEEIIASAFFSFPESDFGTLAPGKSRFWTLTFGPEYVYNGSYDLQNYVIQQNSTYNY